MYDPTLPVGILQDGRFLIVIRQIQESTDKALEYGEPSKPWQCWYAHDLVVPEVYGK